MEVLVAGDGERAAVAQHGADAVCPLSLLAEVGAEPVVSRPLPEIAGALAARVEHDALGVGEEDHVVGAGERPDELVDHVVGGARHRLVALLRLKDARLLDAAGLAAARGVKAVQGEAAPPRRDQRRRIGLVFDVRKNFFGVGCGE
jgi:hypothetical protein